MYRAEVSVQIFCIFRILYICESIRSSWEWAVCNLCILWYHIHLNYTTRRRDLEHSVTDIFCSVRVKWPECNYQKGVEHQSALIWTITVGFIYHQGKQATVGITEKALCVSRLSFNLFQNDATKNTGLKNQSLKKRRCEVCCRSKGQNVFLCLDALGPQLNLFKWKIISNVPSHSPNHKTRSD